MKKFSFSQQNILDIRIAQKQAIEQLLQQQASQVEYEKNLYQKFNTKLQQSKFQDWLREMPIAEFNHYKQQQIAFWKQKAQKQFNNLQKAEKIYDDYIEKIKLAVQECKKLEKICLKEQKKWQIENNRRECKIIDEIASRKIFYEYS